MSVNAARASDSACAERTRRGSGVEGAGADTPLCSYRAEAPLVRLRLPGCCPRGSAVRATPAWQLATGLAVSAHVLRCS